MTTLFNLTIATTAFDNHETAALAGNQRGREDAIREALKYDALPLNGTCGTRLISVREIGEPAKIVKAGKKRT